VRSLNSTLLSSALVCALVFAAPAAFAQQAGQPDPLPPVPAAVAPAAAAPGTQVAVQGGTTTNVAAAPGSGGLTVVVPVAGGGTVTAVGCSSVSVNGHSTEVMPNGAPCPAPAAAPVAPPAYYARPQYAPDGGRKAALITAPIVYGLGAMVAGVSYLSNKADCEWNTSYDSASGSYSHRHNCSDATTSLVAYGVISAAVPSIPRLVVGDTGRGIAYAAARGGSITAAALIDWGNSDDAWLGPFLLGFAAPVALAVVDMATTPHREDLEDKPEDKKASETQDTSKTRTQTARITSVAPIAINNRETKSQGAGLALAGTF
jgi:hypothetical protein